MEDLGSATALGMHPSEKLPRFLEAVQIGEASLRRIVVSTGLISSRSFVIYLRVSLSHFRVARMGAPEVAAVAAPDNNVATAVVPQMSYPEFQRWKQQKDAEAEAKAAEAARKRVEDIAAGRVRMNGRELYEHQPWVFDDARFDT